MRSQALCAALAAVAVSGLALAQGVPPPGGSTSKIPPPSSSDTSSSSTGSGANAEFTKLDKDKDGQVSKKEAASNKALTAKWDTLDVNKDGKLDDIEFAKFEASPTSSEPMK